MLRLELLLPGPPPELVRPLLENDVRRDGASDSPSVAATLLGENERADIGGLETMLPLRSSEGMSVGYELVRGPVMQTACERDVPPSIVSVSALYRT